MSSMVKCVICSSNTNDKIILFVDHVLQKCQSISKVRIKNKLKYSEVNLPSKPDTLNGYHLKCYKNFTAIMKKYVERQEIEDPVASTSQEDIKLVNEECFLSNQSTLKGCIFCGIKRKTYKGNIQKLHQGNISELMSFASEKNDQDILKKLKDCASSIVPYQVNCKTIYYYNYICGDKSVKENSWHIFRKNHKRAYELLCEYIESEIIKGGKSILLSLLFRIFNYHFDQMSNDTSMHNEDLFSEQYLETKIKNTFN